MKLNDTVAISKGINVVVTATNYLQKAWLDTPIRVRKLPVEAMVNYYKTGWASSRKRKNLPS